MHLRASGALHHSTVWSQVHYSDHSYMKYMKFTYGGFVSYHRKTAGKKKNTVVNVTNVLVILDRPRLINEPNGVTLLHLTRCLGLDP